MSLETVKDGVEKILSNYESARNSDILLLFLFWRHVDKVDIYMPKEILHEKMTNPSSIIRMRAKLQNEEGRFQANSDTSQKRRKHEKAVRIWAVGGKRLE